MVSLMFIGVHIDLGNNWSAVPEVLTEHKLVTTGLFGFARHPMYTAIVVYGTVAAYLSTLNFVLAAGHFVSCAGIILPRLPQEEGILVDAFGEDYLEYRARVPALGWGTLWLNRVYQPATTTNSQSIQVNESPLLDGQGEMA
eukprot:CAMPEP_0119506774 /NCGR_PEP_ID=MMETSP1344-20130328/26881_1 /TAXON_ID=236787 /ORGANISM="Florenciella parvula, Strain CCMP2471" /LENGTH=141 /DNA_ID=CAMNT_0007543343 /DNA_START=97 /DNA_END=522 /DNA_ORIENTATION=-